MISIFNNWGGVLLTHQERRQGTGLSLVSTISVKGGLRRKRGGDSPWL